MIEKVCLHDNWDDAEGYYSKYHSIVSICFDNFLLICCFEAWEFDEYFWPVFARNIISCSDNLFIGWPFLTCLYIRSFKCSGIDIFLIKDVTLILLFLEGMTGNNQCMNASPHAIEIPELSF